LYAFTLTRLHLYRLLHVPWSSLKSKLYVFSASCLNRSGAVKHQTYCSKPPKYFITSFGHTDRWSTEFHSLTILIDLQNYFTGAVSIKPELFGGFGEEV